MAMTPPSALGAPSASGTLNPSGSGTAAAAAGASSNGTVVQPQPMQTEGAGVALGGGLPAAGTGLGGGPAVAGGLMSAQMHLAQQAAAAVAAAAGKAPPQAAVPTAAATAAATPLEDWGTEPLFGGAMEVELPMRFHDISDFRPVPDHQEVFADAHQDQSLVVEILEMASVEDQRSAQFFFEDLSVQNDAESSALENVTFLSTADMPHLPSGAVCSCALGYQTIAKGRQTADTSNYVQILLAVLRVPEVKSDVVISLNTPAYISEKSAAAEHAGAGPKTAYLRAPELFRRIMRSFRITDMGLFGGD